MDISWPSPSRGWGNKSRCTRSAGDQKPGAEDTTSRELHTMFGRWHVARGATRSTEQTHWPTGRKPRKPAARATAATLKQSRNTIGRFPKNGVVGNNDVEEDIQSSSAHGCCVNLRDARDSDQARPPAGQWSTPYCEPRPKPPHAGIAPKPQNLGRPSYNSAERILCCAPETQPTELAVNCRLLLHLQYLVLRLWRSVGGRTSPGTCEVSVRGRPRTTWSVGGN